MATMAAKRSTTAAAPLGASSTALRGTPRARPCLAASSSKLSEAVSTVSADALDRRSVLLASTTVAASALLAIVPAQPARALIPDEEDEELLERAKANRQRRLAEQKETTRNFLRDDGLKDKTLDTELIPVQKAVVQLAKSGETLEIANGGRASPNAM
jgi:hypothetical protein